MRTKVVKTKSNYVINNQASITIDSSKGKWIMSPNLTNNTKKIPIPNTTTPIY